MLKIRLQRVGKKNQASFRIVLAEKARSASKKITELLGHYDPRLKTFGIKDPSRLEYWISQHVEISPTVNNLLIDKGLLKGEKVKAWKPKRKKEEEKKEATPAAGPAPTSEAVGAPTLPEANVGETKTEEKPTEVQAEQPKKEEAPATTEKS